MLLPCLSPLRTSFRHISGLRHLVSTGFTFSLFTCTAPFPVSTVSLISPSTSPGSAEMRQAHPRVFVRLLREAVGIPAGDARIEHLPSGARREACYPV